jgi:hypothetical protein
MLKRVYPWIKAADPEAVVLVGGLLLDCNPADPPETQAGSGVLKDCTPGKFLEGILSNGGGEFFDGVAFHSYDYYFNQLGKYSNANWHSSGDAEGPVLIAKSTFIRNILSSYGFSNKLLVNSELALICGRTGEEPECLTEDFQRTKAIYLVQASAAAMAQGLSVNLWYSLEGWRGSGLLDAQLQPNLAFDAFKFSGEKLNGSSFIQESTSIPGVRIFEFERQSSRFWVIWSSDGQPRNVSLPEPPLKLTDAFGTEIPVAQEFTLDYSPVYVDWMP